MRRSTIACAVLLACGLAGCSGDAAPGGSSPGATQPSTAAGPAPSSDPAGAPTSPSSPTSTVCPVSAAEVSGIVGMPVAQDGAECTFSAGNAVIRLRKAPAGQPSLDAAAAQAQTVYDRVQVYPGPDRVYFAVGDLASELFVESLDTSYTVTLDTVELAGPDQYRQVSQTLLDRLRR